MLPLPELKKRLFLSFATTRFKWGQFIDSKQSRFIKELDDRYLEKHQIYAKKKDYSPHIIYSKTKYKQKKNIHLMKITLLKNKS